MAEFGVPFQKIQLRHLIKNFLIKKKVVIPEFKDNMPGTDYITNMLKRHPEFTTKMARSKKLARNVGRPAVEEFFQNLAKELKDVPPENIFNFDETAMVDDPGSCKVVVMKNMKHVEKNENFSKQSTTVPPYIVYKSNEHIYEEWIQNGPNGARYNRSQSGWMDETLFADWFKSLMLPRLKKLKGPKVLIGDNCSSHFSMDVIKLCQANNIRYVCLPPNMTHLLQPLDVGVFRSLKMAWRETLSKYRSGEGKKAATLNKADFPTLLRRCLKKMAKVTDTRKGTAAILKSSFKATGIFPLNKERVLRKMLEEEAENDNPFVMSDALNETLQELRPKPAKPRGRPKKKLNVRPGQSVTVNQEEQVPDSDSEEDVHLGGGGA